MQSKTKDFSENPTNTQKAAKNTIPLYNNRNCGKSVADFGCDKLKIYLNKDAFAWKKERLKGWGQKTLTTDSGSSEEFFYNSLEDKKDLAGIHYDFIDKNWKSSTKNLRDEFDIVMVNGKDIAIIEVKYKAHERDLEKLLTQKQTNFRELFPIYKDYNHHLALASFYMHQDLKEKALENNVIVLQRKGDVMETFIPKNP